MGWDAENFVSGAGATGENRGVDVEKEGKHRAAPEKGGEKVCGKVDNSGANFRFTLFQAGCYNESIEWNSVDYG